ncbi:McrC family protein [Helicobacter sp. T3_23-1056]
MSKNNTLCIAEWQAFGVEDICASLRGFEKAEAIHESKIDCHESANADSRNDDKDSPSIALGGRKGWADSRNDKGLHDKAKKIFNELKNFADDKGNHIFLNSYGKNHLKARNYVGLIQTKSGFCLEILPKTFRTANENEGFKIQNCICLSLQKSTHPLRHPNAREGESLSNNDTKPKKCQVCEAKDILLKMLKTLRDSPFKQSHISNLKTRKFPLLEIFANMFLDELECLIKMGIKSDYVAVEENRTFLKGKLLFTQNLKQNLAHKERFYTASDEFIADIAPNRLIVSTLLLLSKCNFSAKTSGRILQSRFVFNEIAPSQNYDKDFAKCENLRHFKSYEILLLWCKVFLKAHNFMPYQGDKKAFALLFDMNKLFESFVAFHLKRECGEGRTIKTQEKSKYLLEINGVRKFQISPDLVCYENGIKSPLFIADTKWKILDSNEAKNYGISQGDLYQLFAYLAKYQCEKGYLIYPKIDGDSIKHKNFTYNAKICFFDEAIKENPQAHKKQNLTLKIHFFDCQNPKDSACDISQIIKQK